MTILGFFKQRRRAAVRARAFPEPWRAIIDKNVPIASSLTDAERREHASLVAVFVDEKRFEGCAGIEITDEIRVTIAAHACLLILHIDDDFFPTVETILIYPHAYQAVTHERAGAVTVERPQARAGEAWGGKGLLVVVWDEVQRASVLSEHNVVLHEFAHALDYEDGLIDGAPVLPSRERFQEWASVLDEEYTALKSCVEEGQESDLDPYGATNRGEFFAVVTEAFFGAPGRLREGHPALYDELARFYRPGSPGTVTVRRRLTARAVARQQRERRTDLVVVATFAAVALLGFGRAAVGSSRVVEVVDGTVIGHSVTKGVTKAPEVRLDTGPVVEAHSFVDYPVGARVEVEVLESAVLHLASYRIVLKR